MILIEEREEPVPLQLYPPQITHRHAVDSLVMGQVSFLNYE
jgi:hypothetical protein